MARLRGSKPPVRKSRGFTVFANPSVHYQLRYHDEQLLVVDKPAGVATQPGRKHERDSLVNALFVDYGGLMQNMGEARSWGLVHRLDLDTSGLVIVALRINAYEHLIDQFKNRQVKKTYWAVVSGTPVPAQGVIQLPIAEVAGQRKRAVIRPGGRQAITAYRVLASTDDCSLVEARPKTGRMHQIRIHFAHLGHHLLGDTEYTPRGQRTSAHRLCLHAAGLSFIHPDGNRRINLASPLPKDLAGVLRKLGLPVPELSE